MGRSSPPTCRPATRSPIRTHDEYLRDTHRQSHKQGARLAACNLTTHAYTQIIAKETGAEPDAVYKELTTNTIGSAQIVPAGIVAVTRAQEHGYAIVSIG